MTEKRDKALFETVLEHSRDISELYYDDQALRDALSDAPAAFGDLLQAMRRLMQEHGGIRLIADISPEIVRQVEAQHQAGQIGAVDGSDAIAPTEATSKTIYAAAVVSITAQTMHAPRAHMTQSHHQIPRIGEDEDFLAFVEKLDHWVDQDQSWVRSFREHCERVEALRMLREEGLGLVLIDGPLYTQNLLSQRVARGGVLNDMRKHSRHLIGFIKNMRSSKVMHLAGMALQPGEYWVLKNWRHMLALRFKRHVQGVEWIRNSDADWLRVVYRKEAKAFAFECCPKLVETGLALIASPITCASIINHEIPFLLHCADRIVQSRCAAQAKSLNLISSSPQYANLANERDFR